MNKSGSKPLNRLYTSLRMRSLLLVAMALGSVPAAFPQPPGVNVVPNGAITGTFRRALVWQPQAQTRTYSLPFRAQPPRRELILRSPVARVCAVPLLPAHPADTHDRMARPGRGPEIDPKMAAAPAVPACEPRPKSPERR